MLSPIQRGNDDDDLQGHNMDGTGQSSAAVVHGLESTRGSEFTPGSAIDAAIEVNDTSMRPVPTQRLTYLACALKAALRRAAKRHSWTDARVGMMQRIMSVSSEQGSGG